MKITKEPFYLPTGKEIEVFEAGYHKKLPVLLKGPTGTGKSRFVEYMAWKLNKDIITVACHEETSATDLIGRFILKGTEAVWQDGPLTKAVKTGSIIYLDEVAEARPDIIVAIHSLTDYRRTLFLDKLGEEIVAGDGFMLVASYNPGYQKGHKELKPSTRQRFIALSFNYPDQNTETEIVINETGIDRDTAKTLVKLATKIRNLIELGLTETVSTRLLVDAASLIKAGLNRYLAIEAGMLQPLTDDIEILESLRTLTQLML